MVRLGMEMTDGFFAIPITLDVKAVFIQAPATITMAEVIRVVILKGC
jgi:hypothetical protein